MEKNPDRMMLVATGIFIVILIAAALLFMPRIESAGLIIKEAPLQKNSEFRLHSGETYTYTLTMNATRVNVTYALLEEEGCTRIIIPENRNHTGTCVDRYGMDEGGYNSTFKDPAILIFKPWMLALKEGWRWNASTYMRMGESEQYLFNSTYRVVRTENYTGRQSFVVEIISAGGPPEYQWVDAEKRLMLKALGEGYEVLLAED